MAACDCNIRITYTMISPSTNYTNSLIIESQGLSSGYSYYTWLQRYLPTPSTNQLWTLRLIYSSVNERWELVAVTSVTGRWTAGDILAYIDPTSNPGDCPSAVSADWIITGFGVDEFASITTSVECTTLAFCSQWSINTGTATSWDTNLFITPGLDPDTIGVGYPLTLVYSDVSTNTALGCTVAFLVYQSTIDDSILYFTAGSDRDFVGLLLYDNNGALMSVNYDGTLLADNNHGYLCVSNNTLPTNNQIDEECYNILVWDKQCEFGKNVYNYLLKLKFGIQTCQELECLKNQRRALKILNCYDTRDLGTIVPQYNALSYSTIKKLLD